MINENEIKHRSPESMNSIPKVSVELDLYKTSNSILNILNPDNTSKKRESVKSLKNEAIDQSDTYKKIMQKKHIYDEILENMHKLPKWKKLKTVLDFLAILGDPIARLPCIIKLDTIRYWYKSRLNINSSHLTEKQEAKLLESSKRLWKSPRSKIMDKLSIPQSPFSNQEICVKLTWDRKKMALKKINEIKNSYTKRFKELALKNTREMYPTFKTIHYKNKFNKDFKRIYYSYFPAKEGDIIWRQITSIPSGKH
ncbi:unnamed protein product [Aphis gossypii]|uniref:DUF4771 domain-containing protein n=1 Tax=Aphis gossypii TaxID=80765 RepID=A0A9P0JJ46_APHGO|nr:unnamed protein product [Aphis gossypii]